MKYMLDTNLCIYAIKNNPTEVLKHLKALDPSDICISSVTYSELMYGIEKSRYPDKNRIALSLLFANIDILSFDTSAAEEYGRIRTYLERNGSPIGPMDMLIAAHAKSLSCTLVTNNTREFKRVDGLIVENWVV